VSVRIERSATGKRNRIFLDSPYSAAVVAACKSIPGATWRKTEKVWSLPLDFGTCLSLREHLGKSLVIGPELWEWAAAEKERQTYLSNLLDGAQGSTPLVDAQEPKLAAAFASRPYQSTGADFLARSRYGLCGDDPGLGKTLETFGAVVEAGFTEGVFLVFCPSSAIRATWQREINFWLPNDVAIPCDGTRKQREEAFEILKGMVLVNEGSKPAYRHRIWVICNIEMCRVKFEAECPGPPKNAHSDLEDTCDGEYVGCPYARRHKKKTEPLYPVLFEQEWDAIILDESHKVVAGTKSRQQKQSQQRVGFGMLRLQEEGLRIALSGTPWRGKQQNFWGTLNWLRPDIYTGYWRWAEKYFEVTDNFFGGRNLGKFKQEMEEEWNRELRSVMIRRTKSEVAKDLPPKQYAGTHLKNDTSLPKGIWLPMEPEQARVYRKFKADAAVALEGGTLFGNGVLSEMLRMRQLAISALAMRGDAVVPAFPSNKFTWLTEVFLPERGIMGDVWGDRKVLISSNYTKTINLFRAKLTGMGVMSHCITGETKPRDRARQVAEFQGEGGPRVFFLNTNAGGVSLTLDAADDVVKLDRSWDPDDDTQLEDRAHRVSRVDHQVTIYNLYSLDSIDEQIALVADSREDLQKKFLDGARGVAFALKLLNTK